MHHSLLKYSGPYTTLACYVTVMYSYKCTIFAILQCTKFYFHYKIAQQMNTS